MVLMVYNDQICKEILMPNLFNTDYHVRLSARDYGLRSDVELQLERGGKRLSVRRNTGSTRVGRRSSPM